MHNGHSRGPDLGVHSVGWNKHKKAGVARTKRTRRKSVEMRSERWWVGEGGGAYRPEENFWFYFVVDGSLCRSSPGRGEAGIPATWDGHALLWS